MNIAFVHKWYDNIGGTEKNLCELTRWFLQFGHDVHLYCGGFRIAPPEGAVLHRVPYLPLGRTAKLLSFAFLASRAAAAGRHDIVISCSRIFKQDIVRSGGGTHKGYLDAVTGIRGSASNASRWSKDRALLFVERKQFRQGNYRRVIAMSNVAKAELMSFYGVPADKIEVIYNGVDIELYHPRNRELHGADIRRSYGIGKDEILILFVGTGFLRKGLEFVIEAISALKAENLRLMVVGYDTDAGRYKALAKQRGLEKSAIFAGPQKEVHRFYGAADMMVLPSMQDPFGNVVLEAMSSGLPAITTAKVGSSEMMEGRLRRYILDRHDDVSEISRMINELTNKGLRAELSSLARETAERYSREVNARAVERLCIEVAKEKSEE